MTNELQVIEQNEITVAFNTENGIQDIINNIRAQVDEKITGVVWDFTKKKDRDLVASLAHKVARSKTAIDAEGKKLKEQYTVITSKIDAERKLAREALDAEKDRIRKPLTDWENAEKERVQKHLADIEKIKDFAHPSVIHEMTAERIADQIRMLDVLEICPLFEEYEQEAKLAKFETLEALRVTLSSREKYEAEQAELEALRIAEQQRIQREHEERIAREATEKAQREAEEKARLEAERVQREKLEAEQREARLKAEKEQALIREEQLKQKAIADAEQAEIDKQKAIESERQRIEFERLAKEESDRKAEQARLENVEHMRKINNGVLSALIQTGITEDQAKAIIKMIAKREVPNVSIHY